MPSNEEGQKGDHWVSGPRFRIDDYNRVMERVNLGSQDV